MIEEKSCGAIIYHRLHDQIKFLVIQHENGGHWAYPKGHVENDETEIETAIREIQEETGLQVRLNTDFRVKSSYSPKAGTIKEVIYFIGQAFDDRIDRQALEVTAYQWLDYQAALELLTFESDRLILRQARDFICGS